MDISDSGVTGVENKIIPYHEFILLVPELTCAQSSNTNAVAKLHPHFSARKHVHFCILKVVCVRGLQRRTKFYIFGSQTTNTHWQD